MEEREQGWGKGQENETCRYESYPGCIHTPNSLQQGTGIPAERICVCIPKQHNREASHQWHRLETGKKKKNKKIPAAAVPVRTRWMQRKSSLPKPTTHTSAGHPPLLGLRALLVGRGWRWLIRDCRRCGTFVALQSLGLLLSAVRIWGCQIGMEHKELHQTGEKKKNKKKDVLWNS